MFTTRAPTFQLPLSGSPVKARDDWIAIFLLAFNSLSRDHLPDTETDSGNLHQSLSTPSLGITHRHIHRGRMGEVRTEAFNSLSRDHKSVYVDFGLPGAFTSFQLPLSGSPLRFENFSSRARCPSFNSLSRDHLRSGGTFVRYATGGFQLPLSGSPSS